MSQTALSQPPTGNPPGVRRLVEIVIPVYNEERSLEPSVRRLDAYLRAEFPYAYVITIADNASTDSTWRLALRLQDELPSVQATHLDRKGRGRALRQAWSISTADVVAYMDVDLSTDLAGFLPLIAPLLSGHSDLAIGTRLAKTSVVERGPKREFISRTYNAMLRTLLAAGFSDAQCGFKAGRTEVIQSLLPLVEDEEWFFDTELLLIAERNGLRIHEVPVDWIDDPDSRVDIVKTVKADLLGMWRLAKASLRGPAAAPMRSRTRESPPGLGRQLPVFAVIGVLSTIAYLVLYSLLRGSVGSQAANAVALALTAVANTSANRKFTFGIRGRRDTLRDQFGGLVAFAIGLALSSGTLAIVHSAVQQPSRTVELVALVGANALATLARFLLLRAWLFHPRQLSASADNRQRIMS